MSFKNFEKDLERFAKATDITIDEALRSIKIDLFSGIIISTRVDTGRLRGNWQTSNGSPNLSTIERLDEITKDEHGGDAEAEVIATVKGDTTDYLTNNLPYAEYWEEQDGMIAKNMQRVDRFIKKSIRGTK